MLTDGWVRRIGGSAEYMVAGRFTATPSSAFAGLRFGLYPGHVIDTSKYPDGTQLSEKSVGLASMVDVGVAHYDGIALLSSPGVGIYLYGAGGAYTNLAPVNNNFPAAWGAGDTVQASFTVPILGWSSSTQMSDRADTRVVAATLGMTAAKAVASGAVIVYDTVVNDSHASYSTVTGLYTAPVSGQYRISAVTHGTGTGISSFIKIAGASKTYMHLLDNGCVRSGSVTLPVLAGQTIGIHLDGASTLSATNGVNGFLNTASIERLGGPSAISASELVAARFTSSTSQVISTGQTIINFATKADDTHGAVTPGAAWKFVAPIAGRYQVNSSVVGSGTGTSGYIRLQIFKNGTIHSSGISVASINAGELGCNVSDYVQLNAGEYIDIRYNNTSASTRTLDAGASMNFVSIVRQGF